jgi:hypothetical protein
MAIAHSGIKAPAAQHAAVVRWFEAALAPLGYTRAMEFLDGLVVGFADSAGNIDWWVTSTAAAPPGVPAPESAAAAAAVLPTHTAFVAKGSYFPLPALPRYLPGLGSSMPGDVGDEWVTDADESLRGQIARLSMPSTRRRLRPAASAMVCRA